MAIIPPQLLIDDPTIDSGALQTLEQWSDQTKFRIDTASGTEVRATVTHGGQVLGQATFRLIAKKHGRIGIEVSAYDLGGPLAELVQHCERDQWLRIWFDSGYTFAGDGVFRVQFRDYQFNNYLWDEFAGFDVTREKPTHPIQPDQIGRHKSLFCWTLRRWPLNGGNPGWLACDDGAMEIADFIHLDGNMLTMIHAKSADSARLNRGISVASYEVVASQAVKGLRWLEQVHLREGLVRGMDKKVGDAVWLNRRRSNRKAFLRALNALGPNYERRVVILQPQVTSTNLGTAPTANDMRERTRYQQLMTLLNATRASCRSLGAELYVVGQTVPPN
jgi:hypothetical protein